MNHLAGNVCLWDERDGFYYDVMRRPTGESFPVRVRSMVGLSPLFAVSTIEPDTLERLPAFWRRARWFLQNRPELAAYCPLMEVPGRQERRLLSLVDRERSACSLAHARRDGVPLASRGAIAVARARRPSLRASRRGADLPRRLRAAESQSGLFGGNSNWRGPIWLPVNYLVIESLQRLAHYYGDSFTVECPTGSGKMCTLWQVAAELSRASSRLFAAGPDGRRPAHGAHERMQRDPLFKDHITFYEYFHGDTGEGLGARAQTGWTALVAKLLDQSRLWREKQPR